MPGDFPSRGPGRPEGDAGVGRWRHPLGRLALLAGLAALPVLARAAPRQPKRSGGPIEEITVTAPRRPVPLLSAPMSVSAFGGDELSADEVRDTMQLQKEEPALQLKTNSVLGQPYLRGIGSDLISVGSDPSVATFVDDVYQARPVAALQELYDVDRVEVVKGPLGTLFGRNATGGAVRIFSRRPQAEPSAEGTVAYDDYQRTRVTGAVNAPLLDDHLRLRLSGLWHGGGEGYSRNVFLGRDADGVGISSGRAQLLALPAEGLRVLLAGDFTRERDSRNLAPWPDPTCCVNGGILLGGTVPSDPRKVTNDVANHTAYEGWGASARVEWKGAPFTVSSLTAFRSTRFDIQLDLDSTNAPFAADYPNEDSHAWSEEVQLSWDPGGRVSGIAGLYYLHEAAFQALDVQLPAFAVRSQPSGDVLSQAYALFGEGRVQLAPRWAFSAGLRYSHEERRQSFHQTVSDPFGALGPPGTSVVTADDADRWNVLTPRFVLSYEPAEGLLAYGSVSRGFKAGGFNSNALQPAFDPEKVWAYELGLKAGLEGGRVQLSLAGFWYDVSDLQLLALAPGAPAGAFPIVVNAAAATIRGVETELRAEPLPHLTTRLSVQWLDAKFDEFVSVDSNRPANDPDRAGNRLPMAPELATVLSAEYTFPVGRELGLSVRGDWTHQTPVWFSEVADPAVRQGAYGLLGARIALKGPEGAWSVALYGRNLTDELYAQNVIRQDPIAGGLRFWGPPRTFGVELSGRF